MVVTAQTESNNTENVFWVLGRVPRFTFDMNMKSFIFAHFGIISLLYLFVCIYISYKARNRFTKVALLIVSDVDVYMFPVLRSIPSCTTDMNMRSCILNRHKMRQSQIATIQESLPSHFVICRILWSWPWRHKLSPITLKTRSGYLGEYPGSLLTWIWKVSFLPILAFFHCYICLCVRISVIKPIINLQGNLIDSVRRRCVHVSCTEEYTLLYYGHESEKLHFEPSQNATVTNCDNSGILAVAFCDLSHFVIMVVTAQTESNNTENVFWVLGRVPRFTFDMNMKSFIFAHFGIISLLYLFVCMYISYKAHNRFTKEALLIVSDVDVYMFPVLRSIPSCTTDMNLRSCILNRHKMRQSQIATIQESLPSHFVICRILWSWPWRHTLSPITLKTCSGYLGENPGSLLTSIWKVAFLPILVLFHWYICLCVCLSVIKLIIDVPRKPCWKGPILMWTCFLQLGVHPRLLWNLSKQLCFEPSQNATVTNCDNSGILAVAFCDLSHFVIMALTAHTESNNTENVSWVLGRVPRFTFDMNMKSFIFAHLGVISLLYLFVCMYISYKAHNRFTKETLLIVSDVDVYMFPVLRSIPSCTADMNLRSCILNRHKMRQSQIATIQESLPSHFVICRILWSWPWRHRWVQ